MACDKPTGDCTNVSPCGAGCAGCNGSTAPAPVLPKCQDVSLTPGTFTNATVTVNAQGCISAVAKGEPEQYTPDECCGESGGGGGEAGARGPKGDPGAAATISVQSVIGTGTAWSVENIGTSSAAIFKFTAPAAPTGGGSSGGGFTGEVGGLKVVDGLVKTLPTALVTSVDAKAEGVNKNLVLFQAIPDLDKPGEWDITLNIDPLFNNLTQTIQSLHDSQATQIAALIQQVAALANQVAELENQQVCIGTVTSRQSGPITSNYIIEVSGVAPNSTLTLTGWNITSFTTDATGYGITQAQLTATEGTCGTISHPTCALVMAGGDVAIACTNGSGSGGSSGGGGTTPPPPPPPADYWAYNASTGVCELNPTIIGGTPTYTTQAACNAANGL